MAKRGQSLKTPGGQQTIKHMKEADPLLKHLHAMAWRGVATPKGTKATRGADYIDTFRNRTIVIFDVLLVLADDVPPSLAIGRSHCRR